MLKIRLLSLLEEIYTENKCLSLKISNILSNFSDKRTDLKASSECIVLEAEWNKIIASLEINVDKKKLLKLFSRLTHMKKIQIFRHCSDQRLLEICINMKKEKFKPGEMIFGEGDQGDKLYLIYKGTVKVYKQDKFLRELEDGNCFGEVSLLVNEPRSATIIADKYVSTYTLSKDDFISYIDKNMLDFLIKKISLQDNFSTKLEDLKFVRNLGQGKFGYVALVHNGKNLYAIKAVCRKTIEKQKMLIKYFIEERSILLSIDHPYIMKLVKTLKNEEYIFFLMEYVSGLVLSKHLELRQDKNERNKYYIQFYIAMLLIMVNYLNQKNICHRDIKPDNIMIDEKGYLKLIDFGTSMTIRDFTSTITGTPHYIAPEVLQGKGYNYSCDYWSIGIIAFELYYHYYPFGNKASDPMEVYKEILKR